MSKALLLTEGIDDVRALTEIFTRELSLKTRRVGTTPQFSKDERWFVSEDLSRQVVVVSGKDRDRAATTLREHLSEGKVQRLGFDRAALVFDPDDDNDLQWREWFTQKILEPWEPETTDLGYSVSIQEVAVDVLPIPWDSGALFDDLSEVKRCVERVAMQILSGSDEKDSAMVLKLLEILQADGRKTNWKTAFRLLNAIRKPSVEDGFFSTVFGQDKGMRTGIKPALESTLMWPRLAFVAGVEP